MQAETLPEPELQRPRLIYVLIDVSIQRAVSEGIGFLVLRIVTSKLLSVPSRAMPVLSDIFLHLVQSALLLVLLYQVPWL
jgi:hypothetical protein